MQMNLQTLKILNKKSNQILKNKFLNKKINLNNNLLHQSLNTLLTLNKIWGVKLKTTKNKLRILSVGWVIQMLQPQKEWH